jgi:uncharacterized protein YutE (UPF0331/DUF86 family)
MLDISRINSRIKEIRKRLIILERDYKKLPKEKFIKDENINASAERHLQVAIQGCIDIANHIVAALGLEKPTESVSEVFYVLSDNKIIPGSFVHRMVQMTGYRNVLVHEYLVVDRDETYKNINSGVKDISKYTKYIEKFLDKK